MKTIIIFFKIMFICTLALSTDAQIIPTPILGNPPGNIFLDKCLLGTSPVLAGNNFSYRLDVSIDGIDAQNLTIVDDLSNHLGSNNSMVTCDPVLDVNGNLITPTCILIGGSPGPFGLNYGGQIQISYPGTIEAGTSFAIQITVRTMDGVIHECTVPNQAVAMADNILTSSSLPSNYANKMYRFVSNKICVDVIAKNDWEINKKPLVYIGVNQVRYEIEIKRTDPNNNGYCNLYNVEIEEQIDPQAILLNVTSSSLNLNWSSVSGGLFTIYPKDGNTYLNDPTQQLDLNVHGPGPHYIYVDIDYPCAAFPPGPGMTAKNCAKLKSWGPEDCNLFDKYLLPNPNPPPGGKYCFVQQIQPFNVPASKGLCSTQSCPALIPNSGSYCFGHYKPITPRKYFEQEACTIVDLPNLVVVNPAFSKRKVVNDSNDAPGCQGKFYLELKNTSMVTIDNLDITDFWPGSNLDLINTVTCTGAACNGVTIDYLCGNTLFPGNSLGAAVPCNNPTSIKFNLNLHRVSRKIGCFISFVR